jgi:hypothetical protein
LSTLGENRADASVVPSLALQRSSAAEQDAVRGRSIGADFELT